MDDVKGILGLALAWLRFVFNVSIKWPLQLARWIFRARAEQDSTAWVVYQARFIISLIIVVSVGFKYDSLDDRIIGASAYKFAAGLGLSLPLFVAMMAFVVYKATDRRTVIRHLAKGPGLTVAGGAAAVIGGFALAGGGQGWLKGLGRSAQTMGGFGQVLGFLLDFFSVAALPFGLSFAVCSLYYLWRDMFRAADGHPLLPPLVAPWMAVMGTIADFNSPVPNDIPPTISAVISISGSVILIGLSIWEFRHLRHFRGIDWDDPPGQLDTEPSETDCVLRYRQHGGVWTLHHGLAWLGSHSAAPHDHESACRWGTGELARLGITVVGWRIVTDDYGDKELVAVAK